MIKSDPILEVRELGGHSIGMGDGGGQADVVQWLRWHVARAGDDWWACWEDGEVLRAIHVHGVGIKHSSAIIVADLSNGEKRTGGKFGESM